MKISSRRLSLMFALPVLSLLVLTGQARAAALLLNGSFEGPVLTANNFVAGGGDNWTAAGPTGQVFVISNNYGSYGVTPYGSQYLDLNRDGTSDSQTVTGFVAGQTYTFSASFAEIQASTTPLLTLSVSGAAVGSTTFTGTASGPYGAAAYPFQSAVLVFTAQTSGSATLTLTNSSTAATGAMFFPAIAVDNVALATVVPEPATSAALLVGAGVLAGLMVRRRTRLA